LEYWCRKSVLRMKGLRACIITGRMYTRPAVDGGGNETTVATVKDKNRRLWDHISEIGVKIIPGVHAGGWEAGCERLSRGGNK